MSDEKPGVPVSPWTAFEAAGLAQAVEEACHYMANSDEFEKAVADIAQSLARRDDQLRRLLAVVRLYLQTYADTQTHPTAAEEAACIAAARAALP